MKITDIKMTKKGRYALFCDGEFVFSVSAETIFDKHLDIGLDIDDFELKELSKHADYEKAMEKAAGYLGVRPYSRKELIDKLKTKFDELTAESVVNKLVDYGYIDDVAYAELAFRSLFARKKTSSREAKMYLKEKGIDVNDSQIQALFENYSQNDIDRIKDIIAKKYIDRIANRNDLKKTIAALSRKGYSIGDIHAAINDINNEIELEEYE